MYFPFISLPGKQSLKVGDILQQNLTLNDDSSWRQVSEQKLPVSELPYLSCFWLPN